MSTHERHTAAPWWSAFHPNGGNVYLDRRDTWMRRSEAVDALLTEAGLR